MNRVLQALAPAVACGAISIATSTSFAAELFFDFEPNSPTEIQGDAGFYDATGSINIPTDTSGGFGNAVFPEYGPLEFVNLWIVPSNSTFRATSGFNKLQTFAGPGADTVIRSVGRPIEFAEMTLTSGGSSTLFLNGSRDRSLGSNPRSPEPMSVDGRSPNSPVTEIRFQSFGSPPAGFFAIDQLRLNFGRETLLWDQPVNGDFDDPLAWRTESAAPGTPAGTPAGDDLMFDHTSPLRIDVQARSPGDPWRVGSFTVRQGEVTLDINGFVNNAAAIDGLEKIDVGTGSLTIKNSIGTHALGASDESGSPPTFKIQGGGGKLVMTEGVHLQTIDKPITVEQGATLKLTSKEAFNHPTVKIGGSIPTLSVDSGDRSQSASVGVAPGILVVSDGLIQGNLSNAGDIKLVDDGVGPVGKLRVRGNYVQSPVGLLEVELLRANNSVGEATKLVVEGDATLDGTLHITRGEEYTDPEPGDYFTIIEADSIYGGVPPSSQDTLFRGFGEVKGLEIQGNEDVFFGVDYDTRFEGEHRVDIVALETPKRWQADSDPDDRDPLSSVSRNLVLVTHGNTDSIYGGNDFDDIARALAKVASEREVSDFTIGTLNWSQFAAGDEDRRFEAQGIGPTFFESARFGQQYGRMVLDYFAEAGIMDPGGMASIDVIAHSNGNYVADAMFDVLADPELSPFDGARPALLFHTALDAHTPPQEGKATVLGSVPLILRGGQPLGELGDNSDVIEHYFSLGLLGTDGEDLLGGIDNANRNFDITYYSDRGYQFASFLLPKDSHSFPVGYYLDSVLVFTDANETPTISPDARLSAEEALAVISNFGFARSPLAVAASIESAYGALTSPTGFPAGAVDADGAPLIRFRQEYIGKYVIRPALVEISGSWAANPEGTAWTGTTQSPAVASVIGNVDNAVNALSFDFDFVTETGGFLSVFVEDELVLNYDLMDAFLADETSLSFEFLPFALQDGQDLSVTFRLDPLEDGQLTGTFSDLTFSRVSLEVIPEPSSVVLMSITFGLLLGRRGRHRA